MGYRNRQSSQGHLGRISRVMTSTFEDRLRLHTDLL